MIGVIIMAIIVVIVIFLILWLQSKSKKSGTKTVGTTTTTTGSKNKTWNWKKRSIYIWLLILQFIVLDFIYPGGRFESKTLFWFIATQNSDKYVAIKKINDILERDEKKKISSIQGEVKKIEDKAELTPDDKVELGELAKKALNIGKATPQKQVVIAKPKEEVWDWTFEWEATAEQMRKNPQQQRGLINEAMLTNIPTDTVLKFKYKRPSGKLVEMTLSRKNTIKEYYFGRVSQEDLYLRVWLLPDGQNFKGNADNGPGTTSMEVFLKKKL